MILVCVLAFYLIAQLFQQYVLRFSSIANPSTEIQAYINNQHWLNIARLELILLSMFLIVVAWVIICFHFFKLSRTAAITALIFFIFFSLFEVFYRSIELFVVVSSWEAQMATGNNYDKLLPMHSLFNDFVRAIYFPLLFSQLLGSSILVYLSSVSKSWLLTIAMGLNSIRLILRLSDYVGLPNLNIFSGALYFPPVAITFILLIAWAWREYKRNDSDEMVLN